ncbi:ABC transporter permease [Endozoicomonadaceae bacterium StTr2]
MNTSLTLPWHHNRLTVTQLPRLCLSNRSGRLGLLLVTLHLVICLSAHSLLPFGFSFLDYATQHPDRMFLPPDMQHWLGTDAMGRDVLARTLLGGAEAMQVAVLATALSMTLGLLLGISAGLYGGLLDIVVCRCTDLFRAIPWILPLLMVIALFGHSLLTLILVLGLFDAFDIARVIRGATRPQVNQDYVVAARLRGTPGTTLIIGEILPNITGIVMVEAAMRLTWMLLRFSSLSFLGFGASPPSADWGLMIAENGPYIAVSLWPALAPAIALGSLIIGINLLADAIDKALPGNLSRTVDQESAQ